MSLVVYRIHDDIMKVVDHFQLKLFTMNKYVFDDFHENLEYLQSLDPKDCKNQDHYRVLRLKSVRVNASMELIKTAYRKQLLDHHPDKGRRRITRCDDENNDYFVCITKAYDQLRDPVKRISFDSVDPIFDDSVPTAREMRDSFFEVCKPVFDRNARWSKLQPVPSFGNAKTPYQYVRAFYDFWEDFQSWREFSYLDEESKETAESRDERKYIDKINKAERKKKSQEESKRIRNLVDLAYQNDPRVKEFIALRKAEKESEKRAKEEKKLQKKMAVEQALREEKERQQREEADLIQRQKEEANNQKKAKEAVKTKMKVEKRRLRKTVESYNFFLDILQNETNANKSSDLLKAELLSLVDVICQKLSVERLGVLNDEMETASDAATVLTAIRQEEFSINKEKTSASQKQVASPQAGGDSASGFITRCGDREWDFDLTQMLIRAINSHPSGTPHRWTCVAEFMNTHIMGLNVKEKQIIHKAKSIKEDDRDIKREAATHNLTTKTNLSSTEEALRNVKITDRSEADAPRPWTSEEQKLLEVALRTYPASDPARWDKVSDAVQSRSKKECIMRFKDLAEKLKAKKSVQ